MPDSILRAARLSIALAALGVLSASAHPARADDLLSVAAKPSERPHAIYLDVLGKGGLWGVGYDYQFNRWFSVGATATFYVVDQQRVTGVSPYVAAYPLGRRHHRGFLHLGPQYVRVVTPSPVPEWDGATSSGLGAEASAGYEYRNHVLLRLYAMAAIGSGGLAPWVGASVGWTF